MSIPDHNPEIVLDAVFVDASSGASGSRRTLSMENYLKDGQVPDNEVFASVLESSPGKLKVTGARRSQVLSSDDILAATPDRMVTIERGKKRFGGPARSMMEHLKWKMTMKTANMLSGLDEMSLNSDSGSSCKYFFLYLV